MNTDELYAWLNSPPRHKLRLVYQRAADGSLDQFSFRTTQMDITDAVFTAKDVVWDFEEGGGFGVLRAKTAEGVKAIIPLEEWMTFEDAAAKLPEGIRSAAYGVSIKNKTTSFHGITEREWERIMEV